MDIYIYIYMYIYIYIYTMYKHNNFSEKGPKNTTNLYSTTEAFLQSRNEYF